MITLKFTGSHDEIVNDIKHMLDVLEGVKAEEGCKCGGLIEVKPAERPAPVAEDAPSPAVTPAEAPAAEVEHEPTPTPEPASAPAVVEESAPTAADCKARLIELRNKRGSATLRSLLKSFGAMTFGDLKADQYAAIMEAADKELINGSN